MKTKDIDDFLKKVSDFNKEKREATRYRQCYGFDCDEERCRCYTSDGNLDPELERELNEEKLKNLQELLESW